jgi:hypothetical protein
MSTPRRNASDVAARQFGVITAGQANDAGLTEGEVRTLVETGLWDRRWRRVFSVTGAPPSYEADVLTVCLAAGPTAVACRGSVARLLGIGRPSFDDAPVEISVARGASVHAARRLGAIVHVHRHLGHDDRTMVGPIPVTGPARLIVDLLGEASTDALFAVADDVLARHWTEPDGVRLHPVRIPGRAHPRLLDLAYPDARIAPEYDGRREHGPRRWAADAIRDDELDTVGWLRLPAGRHDLVEPGATEYCDVVRAALQARAA